MTQSEWMNLCMQLGILAVASYAAIMVTRVWLVIRSRSDVWAQVASMLELMQRYFADAQREHVESVNELRPAINGAKDVIEEIKPAIAAQSEALSVKTSGGNEVPIGEYVRQNTHDLRDGLQRILTAVNRLEMRIARERE